MGNTAADPGTLLHILGSAAGMGALYVTEEAMGLALQGTVVPALAATSAGTAATVARLLQNAGAQPTSGTPVPIWDVRASRGGVVRGGAAAAGDYGIGYRTPGSAVNDIPRGGAYRRLERVRDHERHHMPANSVNGLSISRGPAIQMRIEDHARTSSYGNSHASRAYRERVRQLVEAGRMRDAMAMEIRDVRRISGSSYNNAIRDILAYAREQGLL